VRRGGGRVRLRGRRLRWHPPVIRSYGGGSHPSIVLHRIRGGSSHVRGPDPGWWAEHARSVTRYSMLDLCSVKEGGNAAESFRNALDLARHAEKWGYTRFWLAEHHNMEGIASSATSVLIGHVAGETETIRVGSGGVMLPNHAPLIVAEH